MNNGLLGLNIIHTLFQLNHCPGVIFSVMFLLEIKMSPHVAAGSWFKQHKQVKQVAVPVGRVRGNLLLPHFVIVQVCVMWCSRCSITPSEVWMTRFPWSGGRHSRIRLWWMAWGCFQWWICGTGPRLTVTHWAAKKWGGSNMRCEFPVRLETLPFC